MAASGTDKFKKLSKRLVVQVGAGGISDAVVTTIPLSSVTNLATDTAVVVVIDRVDSNGVATPSLEETVVGVVSGSNLVSCTRGAEGTAQAHNAGAVVEVLVTAKGWNDLIDGLLVGHHQDGTHVLNTDGTLSANSDTQIPSQKAVKTYSDAHVITASSTTTFTNKTIGDTLNMTTGAITQSGTAAHITLTPGTSKLVKIAALEQDITSNNYRNNTVVLTGWNFITGDGSNADYTKAITFGITFVTAPIVIVSLAGSKTSSDPTAIGDLTGAIPHVNSFYSNSVTTGGFTMNISFNAAYTNGTRGGFAWYAIGTL